MNDFKLYFSEQDLLTDKVINNEELPNVENTSMLCCYPTSNEFLGKYFKKCNFKHKRVATVGSSFDQALNAVLYGSRDVTLMDGNPIAPAFAEYKMALIKNLDFEEFKRIFCPYSEIINIDVYKKISHSIPEPMKQFWDGLMLEDGNYDESLDDAILHDAKFLYSPFYTSKEAYEKLQKILRTEKVNVQYIIASVFDFPKKMRGEYDYIFLSNIYDYMYEEKELETFYKAVHDMYDLHLRPGGSLQVWYQYNDKNIDIPMPKASVRKESIWENDDDYGCVHYVHFIDKPLEKEKEK